MRLIKTAILAVALVAALESAAAGLDNEEVSVDRGTDRTSYSIQANAHGALPDTDMPAPVVRHGLGEPADPAQHVDCNALDPAVPATPAAIRDCAVPTPRLGGGSAAAAGTLAQQAAAYATSYFRSIELPKPAPKMSSPDGVCGGVHYLDPGIGKQLVYQDPDTAFGPLLLHVTASFVTDWGDGTAKTGAFSHTWTTKGTYVITTTANWSATWSFGKYSGVITGPSTTGTIEGWQVRELQAVITEG